MLFGVCWCIDPFKFITSQINLCQPGSPVGWGCRIHRLHHCRGLRPPPIDECPGYDTKQSDGEAPVMLGHGECRAPLHCHCFQVHSGPEW